MRLLLLTVAAICAATVARCQVSVTGKVSDGKNPLPSVTVLLLSPDSTWIKTTLSDNTGDFVFADVTSGNYMLSVSMVGYRNFFSTGFTIGENDHSISQITLEETGTELGEVVVSARKQLFDQQIDRLVVNVASSITSSGNTVLEVLQKSPGIVVNKQNGLISMNGKGGVLVMVNDKLLRLPMDVVVAMLDGMNASGVEKLELITTPPSRYDADGNAGVIHIITKGRESEGTNVSLGVTAGAKWAETFGGNAVVNHRGKQLAYFIDYSILRTRNMHRVVLERTIEIDGLVQTVVDDSDRENITTQQNLSAGLEGKLNDKTSISLLVTAFSRNWDMDATATDINNAKPDSTVVTSMKVHESNIWNSGMASIGLRMELNAKSSVSVNLDYLSYHNTNPSQYEVNEFYEQQSTTKVSAVDLTKTTPINVLVLKSDYQREVSSRLSWETGVKAVASSLSNNVFVQKNSDGTWITDPTFTSYSDLRERVLAAYLSSEWQAGKKWQINTGLRYEYTHTTIGTPSDAKLVDRKYGYLFPSLGVRNRIGASSDLQFSYARRITRPTYNDIAPFVFFWSPNTFSAGNTALYPAIADGVSASYHRNQWTFSLQFTQSKNDIAFLQPETDSESGNLTYRSQNLEYMRGFAATNSYSTSITRWLEIQSSITAQRQVAKTSHLMNDSKLGLYNININVILQFRLPHDFSMEISGMYQSRSLTGISQYLSFGSLNAGIQKSFGEGTLKLSVDDMLNTNNWRIKTESLTNDLDAHFNYYWHNRYIRLTYSWNLGNAKLKTVKMKSGSDEERSRVN